MRRLPLTLVPLFLIALAPAGAADDADYKPLFNGKDLTGWARVNCHPDTFFVKDSEIITTGKPSGYLRTDKQYENFVAEFEWMHENKKEVGNSGFFVWGDALPAVGTVYTRGIEVQVLVNLELRRNGAVVATSHGDVFSIHGATCKPDRPHPTGGMRCLPSENRAKGGGEWNHYKIVANDGAIKLHVNGKEVSGVSECRPRKGYLALESEGAVCHFRNLKIKELPSTNPKPEDCATVDEGYRALFDGLTLNGWKSDGTSWKVAGENLRCAGTAEVATEKAYGPGQLIFDWKVPGAAGGAMAQYSVSAGGKDTAVTGKSGAWHRVTVPVAASAPIRFAAFQGVELKNVFFRSAN